jgi:3-dehydroquinate synthase
METITVRAQRPYKVYVGRKILGTLPGLMNETLGPQNPQIYIVTDRNVSKHYLRECRVGLRKEGYRAGYAVFRHGERLKSQKNLSRLLHLMVTEGLSRDSVVIGLGGGVVGDFAGFAASIYMRGCNLLQVPTTLLSQVDSSIGGKVGINLREGKNLVGSFYSPLFVLIDLETLTTLPEREFLSGFAEVIKYGLIFHKELFGKIKSFFEKNVPVIDGKVSALDIKESILHDISFLAEIISRSVKIKGEIVCADERENDLRMILNFGHTFAHAVEQLTGYRRFLHGEAVLLGMKMAAELSLACGMLRGDERDEILDLLNLFKIPSLRGVSSRAIYHQIGRDKKKKGGKIHYTVLKEIGYALSEPDIDNKTTMGSIEKVLSSSGS